MRRILRGVVGLVVLGLVGAGVALYYFNYSPDRTIHPLRGIDVSHHQGVVDWGKVAKSDVAFAILKATEGGDYVDETFARNLAGAEAAGLVVGAYRFFTFCRAGAEQAANFLKVVPRNRPMLPPAVDIEFVGNCAARPRVRRSTTRAHGVPDAGRGGVRAAGDRLCDRRGGGAVSGGDPQPAALGALAGAAAREWRLGAVAIPRCRACRRHRARGRRQRPARRSRCAQGARGRLGARSTKSAAPRCD